jgi:hypothetical protein
MKIVHGDLRGPNTSRTTVDVSIPTCPTGGAPTSTVNRRPRARGGFAAIHESVENQFLQTTAANVGVCLKVTEVNLYRPICTPVHFFSASHEQSTVLRGLPDCRGCGG